MKRKFKVIQVVRYIIQAIFFVFFIDIFALTFDTLKRMFGMIFYGQFQMDKFFVYSIMVSSVVLLTIILGRFFCGWMCAFGSLNDLIFNFGRRIFKSRIRISKNVDYIMKFIKYILLFDIIVFIWILGYTLDDFDPWIAFAQITKMPASLKKYPLAFLILISIFIGAMFIERFFCRYLCPLGAILAILSKIKLLNIKRNIEVCGSCKLCNSDCPMGIDVANMNEIKSGECIKCLKCVPNCNQNNSGMLLFNVKINNIVYIIVAIAIFSSLYETSLLLNKDMDRIAQNSMTTGGLVIDSSQETGDDNSMDMNSRRVSDRIDNLNNKLYHDGVYTGTSEGYRPGLKVSVTIKGGKITDIKIISHNESSGYYEEPFRLIPKEIIRLDSLNVDAVSGATLSSEGVINAVMDALKKAEN